MKWFGSNALSALCSTIKTENTTFQETVGDTINEVYENMDDIDSRVTTLEGKADNDTTYTAGTGLALSGTTFNHSNSVTAGTAGGDSSKTLTFGGTFTVPKVTYDAQGHITGKSTTTMTMPANPNTDTHYTSKNVVGATTATSNTTSALSNGSVYLNSVENGSVTSTHKISGSGATTVTTDTSGNIVITSTDTDTNTTYTAGTGLALSGTTINHSNSVTAATATGTSTSTLSHGGTFKIPTITYDAQGHITSTGTTTLTLPSSGNTDRYVNTAAFAQDTTNNNVKMTLTRAGSDTSTVTANIPASSSSEFGVMKTGTGLSASSGTVSLASVSTSATTSTASPSHGGTFTAVDGVTTDSYGRVTAVNTKTVTLPTDTDTKATQTITTTNADYRVILSANANDTTETSTLRKSAGILANASTGEIYAQGYRRIDISGQTIDLDDLTLSSGSPHIVRYIEKTSAGSTNISNIPVTGVAFILDVEAVRINTTSDYITRQTFASVGATAYDYVRWCTSGTWSSWQKRTYSDTDTKVTNTLATTTKAYVTGTTSSSTNTGTQVFDTGVYLDTTAGKLTASTFSGALSGNATTATTLATARTIQTNLASTASASFNGSANITPGVTGVLPISNGGTGTSTGHIAVDMESRTTSTASPSHGETFTVIDSITNDDNGHIITANTKTITLPSDTNTDTKVTNTLATTTKAYVTGTTSSTTNTGTQVFDTGVYLDTTAGKLTATTFSGALSGNATTATTLATGRTIQTNLASTASATFNGSANVTPGVTGILPIANGGTGTSTGHVTVDLEASTTSTASPDHGGTFTVIDSITHDDNGHIITANTKTVTLPSDNNTDTKVTNTLATTTKAYVTGTTTSTTNTGTQVFDTGVYLDTTAGKLTATTFSGALSGNASTATALTTSAGSATQPVYFSSGKPVACTYTLAKSVPSDAVFTDTTATYTYTSSTEMLTIS